MIRTYGIDLGTSNCLIAKTSLFSDKIDVSCLRDKDNNISFPSIIHFKSKDEIIVGEEAYEMLSDNPENTKEFIKVRLGKNREIPFIINGEKYHFTPQKLTGLTLRHFNVIHNNSIKRAVLTVPANFDQNQRKATLDSGEIAGIEIVELIEEPTAAIMYHIFSNHQKDNQSFMTYIQPKNILVFDFGGGTLDLSLTNISLDENDNIVPEVLLTGGDNDLGGNTIDFEFTNVIIDYLLDEELTKQEAEFIKKVKDEYRIYHNRYRNERELVFSNNCDEKVKRFILYLKNRLEKIKINLSTKEKDELLISNEFLDIESIEVTREIFNEMILEDSFIAERVKNALEDFSRKNSEGHSVDEVILVGGSSQIPYLGDLIEREFETLKGRIIISNDYKDAIAKGASIIGSMIDGNSIEPFGTNRCSSVVNYDILVKSGNDTITLVNSGTSFPFEETITKKFSINHSLNECINIQFMENLTINNTKKLIKDLNFYHPLFYTGDDLEIYFDIDEKGIFNFKAVHSDTEEAVEFESERVFELSDDEIEKEINANKLIKDLSR